ncbi:unnamed protein product, partial [Adineta ricciae]
MEQTKPQRRTNIFDYWSINKRMKLTEIIDRLPIHSRTKVENLANELFYEIFSYLDLYDVYKAFYNLNARFQNLLINSTLPLNVNLSTMSRKAFQSYHRHMIMSNKHRIASMSISNPFIVDLVFSPVRTVSHYNRLEMLVFNQIKSKYLINILHYLSYLPDLKSLTIIPADELSNRNEVLVKILSLPGLKYCKMSLKERSGINPLTIPSTITSPLEHLVIDHDMNFRQLKSLLSYVPQLRHLTCYSVVSSYSSSSETFTDLLCNLTHVSLQMTDILFNSFEPMIRDLFHHLQVLRISANRDSEYLNADRWERLITSFIPQLRVFDMQYTDFGRFDNDPNQYNYDSILNKFGTPFWYQRKWFFGYRLEQGTYYNHVTFYSRRSYRKKQYILYKPAIYKMHRNYQIRNIVAVDHLIVCNEEAVTNCQRHFPNVTQLTLAENFRTNSVCLRTLFKRIVPLNQITALVIKCDNLYVDELVNLLHAMPSIHTLTYEDRSLKDMEDKSTGQSDLFQLVRSTNTIRNVTITEGFVLKNTKLIISLCPQIQHLTICQYGRNTLTSIQFILSKIKSDLPRLCSFRANHTPKTVVASIKTMLESEG